MTAKHEPRIPVSFSLPAKDGWMLETLKELSRMEGIDRSRLIRKALLEYFHNHGGENPQMRLKDEGPPVSPSLQEAGIRKLRTVSRLSFEKIAQITSLSFRQVRNTCRDCPEVKVGPRHGFPLPAYQDAWRKFLAGSKWEEAFRLG